jgi:Zn-finger nucleic acid-binding protein
MKAEPEVCPECGKSLYSETDAAFVVKKCFACGYYWHDGKGYSELDRHLFKKYFPTERKWEPSPAVGQPFTSPEHWTLPKFGCCPISR